MNSEVTTGYILAAVFIAAGITFLLRLLPFGLKKALAGSELLDALSHWIPLGAVALLAIYAVAKINYSSFATAAPYLAGLVVTVGVHLWRKNMVLSMVAGTVTWVCSLSVLVWVCLSTATIYRSGWRLCYLPLFLLAR